ncbi:cytochrome P450 [Nocardia sp. XZ_19_369]|uniref:cytochrome P450 n=1 Tax=Nocardia sp. XZ_19_369 TaxID=2769487 RepID=UPI00188EAE41|nr:cytochrome P450 [Nocardia sp. XZ_19_369]
MTVPPISGTADDIFARLFLTGDFVEDPYPDYEELRLLSRAHRLGGGALVVTAYGDCAAVLRDPRFGNDMEAIGQAKGGASWRDHASLAMLSRMMLIANPPRHGSLHRRVGTEFTPARIRAIEPVIARAAGELFAGLCERGGGDFISMYADVLPLLTIHAVLGIPDSHRIELRRQTLAFNALFERGLTAPHIAAADDAVDEITLYLTDLIAYRRGQPADDLVSALVAAANRGAVAEDELVPLVFQVYNAAYQTTMSLLGNGLRQLLLHPAELARLRGDPLLLSPACDELARIDPPVQSTGRHAFVDLDLDGIPVRAGDMVIAIIAAANRDPARFHDPERLDVGRVGPTGLSYGYGPHYCLGAALAAEQLRATLRLLTASGVLIEANGPMVRLASANMRGFAHLPVTIHHRAKRVDR